MLWMNLAARTLVLAELLAKLFTGCGNSPRLADRQAIDNADKTKRTTRKFAQLHVIFAEKRHNCWHTPVTAASRPLYCQVSASQPAPISHDFKRSPYQRKQCFVFLDQQSPVAVPFVDVLPC